MTAPLAESNLPSSVYRGGKVTGVECVDDNLAFWDQVVGSLTDGTSGTGEGKA